MTKKHTQKPTTLQENNNSYNKTTALESSNNTKIITSIRIKDGTVHKRMGQLSRLSFLDTWLADLMVSRIYSVMGVVWKTL